jgi:hypothetical protein
MLAAGGKASSGYFHLLDLQVSELLFHIDVYTSVQKRTQPKEKPSGFGGDIQWEE